MSEKKILVVDVEQNCSERIEDRLFDEIGEIETRPATETSGGWWLPKYTLRKLWVAEFEGPAFGHGWYIKGPDGKCQFYKENYDTSG